MSRKPGDWDCSSCHHLNFSWRDSCQRCSDPRPRGGSARRSDEGDDGYGSFRRGGSDRDYGRGYGGGDGGSLGYGRSDVRPGDWYCSARGCGVNNFASRSSCFKCGALKDEAANDDGGYGGGREGGHEPGDRSSRGSFGFASSYNSRSGGGGRSDFKSGDWLCARSGCKEHNFASRTECFRCHAPRESGTAD